MSARDDLADDDAYEAREAAIGEVLGDREASLARPVCDDPTELLRRHVWDWGQCGARATCDCSDAMAWRWLQSLGIDAGPADPHGAR